MRLTENRSRLVAANVISGHGLMALAYKKSFSGAIRVDNTGASADLPLYQGNLWLFGIMEAE